MRGTSKLVVFDLIIWVAPFNLKNDLPQDRRNSVIVVFKLTMNHQLFPGIAMY